MRLISCAIGAFLSVPAAASAAELQATMATSLSSGNYGTGQTTGTTVTSYGVQAELDGWRLQMTLPRLQISGADSATIIDGNIVPVPGSRNRAGYGDMIVKVGHKLPIDQTLVDLAMSVQLKLPTGARGLTTGQTDVTVALEASKTLGPVTPYASIGYQRVGDMRGLRLADGWTANAGAMVTLGRNLLMVELDASHAMLPGAPARSLLAVAARPVGGGWSVSVYGGKGLSAGAANLMTGIGLSHAFGR